MTNSVQFRQAAFIQSASSLYDCPPDMGVEIGFAGRSNAGKSSALNRLTGQKSLARVSKTPGRTQLLNFFDLGEQRKIVDLPGYGYAKVPDAVKRKWGRMLDTYLSSRHALSGLVLVMDCRHPLTDYDLQLLDYCESAQLPVHCLLTKADKISRGKGASQCLAVQRTLQARQMDVTVQLFSALKGTGLDTLRQQLSLWYNNHAAQEAADAETPEALNQEEPDQQSARLTKP